MISMTEIFLWAVAGILALGLGLTVSYAARSPALHGVAFAGPAARLAGVALSVTGVIILWATWIMAGL